MSQLLPIAPAKITWRIIAGSIMKTPWHIAAIFLIFAASSLLELVIPWQIGHLIDQALQGTLTGFPWETLTIMGAAVLASGAVNRLWVYQSQVVGTRVNKDLGIQMIESSLNLDTQTVEDAGSGDLVARITDDLDSVRQIITDGIPEFIAVCINILVIIGAVFILSPALGLMSIPMLLIEVALFSFFLPRIAVGIKKRTTASSALTTTITENVHGMNTAKELSILPAREQVFEEKTRDYFLISDKLIQLRALFWALDSFAAYTPVLLSIIWGAYCVNHGWTTWGNVATASVLVFNMRVNADIFSYWLDRIREMTITMGRIAGVINLAEQQSTRRHQATQNQTNTEQTNTPDAITLHNVNFSYTPNNPIISNINLKLQQGQTLALVGRSGSGKTTLARLIAGSLTATEGNISVMGQPVGNGQYPTIPGTDGRPPLLICTQEAHLFIGTIADNLTAIAPNATNTQMLTALHTVGAHWIDQLPESIHTKIDTENHALTRDQIQQLALARIALANPHVVILDESTTQLELADARTSLAGIMAKRAVIIISHDARIASLADHAILLHNGTITAEGTPTEIFAQT